MSSAEWMIEQCQEAHQNLLDAELEYLDLASQATTELTTSALRQALAARDRWDDAVWSAARSTDRLGDSEIDLGETDLDLGHAVVISWSPHTLPAGPPVDDGDLGATPDGTLWVSQSGHLLQGEDGTVRRSWKEFCADGGVLITHQGQWSLVLEAVKSRFPYGTKVSHSTGNMEVTAPTSGSPWAADRYFPCGRVHTTLGWWKAENLEPM